MGTSIRTSWGTPIPITNTKITNPKTCLIPISSITTPATHSIVNQPSNNTFRIHLNPTLTGKEIPNTTTSKNSTKPILDKNHSTPEEEITMPITPYHKKNPSNLLSTTRKSKSRNYWWRKIKRTMRTLLKTNRMQVIRKNNQNHKISKFFTKNPRPSLRRETQF